MNATDQLLLETRDVAEELNTGIHMVMVILKLSQLYHYNQLFFSLFYV